MAFGKITKEDLVAAGLDPDKFASLIGTAVSKDDLNALKTEFTSAFDAIKQSLEELKNKTTTTTTTTNNDDKGKDNTEELSDFDQFTSDPTGFINKKAGNAAAFAAVEIMKTRRQIAYDNARNNLKGFKNETLRTEIEKELEKYPAEKMAQFGTDPVVLIQQIHDMVMGRHHDEIMQDTAKKDGKFNLVHSGSSSGSSVINDTNNTNTKRQLTDAEKKVAKDFGMTDDEWLKQEEDMELEETTRRKKGAA